MLRPRSLGRNPRGRRWACPRIEVLEDRDAPATLNVASLVDNYSFGSLRYYLSVAQPGDALVMPAGTMNLNGTEVTVDRSVSIVGPGAGGLTIDGGLFSRVFNIAADATVTLSGMTISGGKDALGGGGGIRNAGALTVSACALTQNHSVGQTPAVGHGGGGGGGGGAGGAIYNLGSLTILNSAIFANRAVGGNGAAGRDGLAAGEGGSGGGGGGAGLGGGIFVQAGQVRIVDSTLSGNSAVGGNPGFGHVNPTLVYPTGGGGLGLASGGPPAAPGGWGGGGGGGVFSDDVITAGSGGLGAGGGGGGGGLGTGAIAGNGGAGGFGGGGGGGGGTYAGSFGNPGNEGQGGFGGTPGGAGGGTGGAGAGFGGAVFNFAGTVVFANSTLTADTVAGGVDPFATPQALGGEVFSFPGGGSVRLVNTIVGGHLGAGAVSGADVYGSFISEGYNLIGVTDGSTGFGAPGDLVGTAATPRDPRLGPLQNNGGPTFTRAPLTSGPASIAINAGTNLVAPALDQRGFARVSGPTVDIGAVESQSPVTIPTTISLQVTKVVLLDPFPPVAGQSFRVVATVTTQLAGAFISPVTGTVRLSLGGLIQDVPLSGGQATWTVTGGLSAGSYNVGASTFGLLDAPFSPGSASTPLTIGKAASTTTFAPPTDTVFGQAATFTATVDAVAPGTANRTGLVSFYAGGNLLGSTAVNGSNQAAFTTTALAVGGHSITAVYQGDGNFTGSTSPAASQNVGQAATNTLLTSLTVPTIVGQTVTLLVQVAPQPPGAGVPTGTVAVFDGADLLAGNLPLVNGLAIYSTSALGAGTHDLTARYSGDANFTAPSPSPVLHQQVLAAPAGAPDLALTMTRDGAAVLAPGRMVRYSMTVTNNGPGTVTGVTLVNRVPASLADPVFTPSSGAYVSATGAWTGISLAPSEYVTLTLSGTIRPADDDPVTNTATVFPLPGASDPNPTNNVATAAGVVVSGVGPVGDTLFVVGRGVRDIVSVSRKGDNLLVTTNYTSPRKQSFPLASVAVLQIALGAGNDTAAIADNVTVPAVIRGGDGNDRLFGGGGPTVLAGGAGSDLMDGSTARNILIGGTDKDTLRGRKDNDLVTGGSTVFDDDPAVLGALLREWMSLRTLEERITNLSGDGPGFGSLPRENGVWFLRPDLTVFDDGVRDDLTGSGGLDWYFANPDQDRRLGRTPGERLDVITALPG